MINADSCCDGAKNTAKVWLDSIGSENEKEMAKKFIAELKEDVISIDDFIVFFNTTAKEYFSQEEINKYLEQGTKAKKMVKSTVYVTLANLLLK